MAVTDKGRTEKVGLDGKPTREIQLPFTIEETFVAVMRKIGPIAKNQTNESQGYKFRGIDDVLAEVNAALTEYGLFYLPNVISYEREWRQSAKGTDMVHVFLIVRYDFYNEAGGGPLSMTIPTEGRDASDKATNKAMTGALKYGLLQCFAIPIRDADEQDKTSPESHGPARSSAPAPTSEGESESEARPVPLDKRPRGVVPLLWTKQVAGSLTADLDPAGDMALEWWREAMILNDLMSPDDKAGSVERITDDDASAVVEVLVAHLNDHTTEKEASDDAKADDRSEQEAIDHEADGYGSGY